MTIERKVGMGIAGQPTGGAVNVADVFSTYLYTGNGSTQTINNGIALGDTGAGSSVEFNGTTDYLSRSSDLTGNTDSQTFTFSAWIYFTHLEGSSGSKHYIHNGNGMTGYLGNNNTELSLYGTDSANGFAYWLQIDNVSPLDGWVNLLVSIDVSDVSKRHVYLGDVLQNPTWNAYDTTKTIDFTSSSWAIASKNDAANKMSGRMTQLFLDHTYRDLSIEANRRLFITSDGQPVDSATLAALSPILYMPLNEDNSIGKNLGTGGDFTVNGSPRTLSTGGPYIDAGYGKGGMVWIKNRTASTQHTLLTTDISLPSNSYYPINFLATNSDGAMQDIYGGGGTGPWASSFLSDGFSLYNNANYNTASDDYVSWTFRKAPKFFDIVTYSGNSVAGREIPHNLGSVPAMMIVKSTSRASGWFVFHKDFIKEIYPAQNSALFLNGNDTGDSNSDYWNNTLPTDSVFSLGGAGGSWGTNGSGETYVAYLFADNSTEDAAEQMIKCGSYTATGDDDINLGWEPQFILSKRVNSAGDWEIHDTVRGLDWGAYRYISPNNNQAESSSTGAYLFPTATGFTNKWFSGNDEIIYMAIRAPMMKEPESATEVFAVDSITSSISQSTSTFPVDFAIASAGTHYAMSRLTGTNVTATNSYGAEFDWGGGRPEFDLMDGISLSADMNGYLVHMFKRAKGFMDCVAYSGGITSRPHSLGVTPEFIIIKARNTSEDWVVWHKDSPLDNGSPQILKLNSNGNAGWSSDIIPNLHTDTTFEVGGVAANQGGANLIAYLFASLDGVSKVGSYTGNGTSITINCGFSAGSRFILIKRTDASGDWYIWDTTRGIVAGNDPHLSLNTTVAEVTTDDSVDPDNSGFIVNQVGATNINVSSGTYIYLAIA